MWRSLYKEDIRMWLCKYSPSVSDKHLQVLSRHPTSFLKPEPNLFPNLSSWSDLLGFQIKRPYRGFSSGCIYYRTLCRALSCSLNSSKCITWGNEELWTTKTTGVLCLIWMVAIMKVKKEMLTPTPRAWMSKLEGSSHQNQIWKSKNASDNQ